MNGLVKNVLSNIIESPPANLSTVGRLVKVLGTVEHAMSRAQHLRRLDHHLNYVFVTLHLSSDHGIIV
jgi:hypothetical protein